METVHHILSIMYYTIALVLVIAKLIEQHKNKQG